MRENRPTVGLIKWEAQVNLMETTKENIISTAQQFFYSRGYESTSIAAIIAAVGIAKGTFYHHFTSKEELLEAMVQAQLETLTPHLEAIATDSSRPALERLREFFAAISAWKVENREVMVETVRMLYAPENIRLRDVIYQSYQKRFAPLISRMVADGATEGSLDCPFAEEAGRIVFQLSQGMGDTSARLTLATVEDPTPERFEELWRMVTVYMSCIERIIGAPAGSLQIVSRETVEAMVLPKPGTDGGSR
ncbi:MAG: TetR/AcrR family transcriptional regulator [Spirochaetota bacterium]